MDYIFKRFKQYFCYHRWSTEVLENGYRYCCSKCGKKGRDVRWEN